MQTLKTCLAMLFLLFMGCMTIPIHADAPTDPVQAMVEKATNAAASGDFTSLKSDLTPEMSTALTPDVISAVAAQLFAPLGAVKSEKIDSQTNQQGFNVVTFTVTLEKGLLTGTLAMDASGKIAGLRFQPVITKTFANYVTKADAHLPFHGVWFAFWGGFDPAKNHHADDRAQKYAYDMVIQKNGVTHRGDGTHNTDYYAYGQPVLAPVAGHVVIAVDGNPENIPGHMNPYMAFGNYVVIDDGHREFAVLAHLQSGRLKVKKGDLVKIGQVIGFCGNSGNSSEPHLHFHMQNSPDVADADGLPITFHHFIQDGKKIVTGVADGQVTLANQGQ